MGAQQMTEWGTGPDSVRRLAWELRGALRQLAEDGNADTSTGWDDIHSVIKRLRQTAPRTDAKALLNVCARCHGTAQLAEGDACHVCVLAFADNILVEHPDERVHFEDPRDGTPEGAVCGAPLEAEGDPTQFSAGPRSTFHAELATCPDCLSELSTAPPTLGHLHGEQFIVDDGRAFSVTLVEHRHDLNEVHLFCREFFGDPDGKRIAWGRLVVATCAIALLGWALALYLGAP